ncbi:MAG TPA: hypothetical protein VKB76_08995 [Ktedonobacterales bacterium]|nr:hypothetical protein [Ktedonobacterales bacterium]
MNTIQTMGRTRLIIAGVLFVLIIGIAIGALRGNHTSATTAAGCHPAQAATSPAQHSTFTEYPMPHAQSDLMSPAMDAQGNIWVGEMGGNRIGRLNPTAHTITEWAPPHGENGIMGIVTDRQGNVWFAEEAANYIGRFDPAACHFTTYSLPQRNGAVAAPDGVALAADGTVWYTQFGNNEIGSLNPQTGAITTYPLPIPDKNTPPLPYGITVDHQGAIWFTELGAGAIGKLDPATGKISAIPLSNVSAQPNTIITAPDGKLWFTEMNTGVLGMIDPTTGNLVEHPAPAAYGTVAQLYDVASGASGALWMTSSGANALLRYDPAGDVWSKTDLPEPDSAPYGLAVGRDGTVWFTEAAPAANRIGVYQGA